MDNLRSEIPADRIGLPEEVAKLVLQTAQAPEYMTGQIITIDGAGVRPPPLSLSALLKQRIHTASGHQAVYDLCDLLLAACIPAKA